MPPIASISTDYNDLGRILEIGASRAAVSLNCSGHPPRGTATIALTCLARVQTGGETVAYVDLNDTFEPEYAEGCGVDVGKLLLVRPQSTR